MKTTVYHRQGLHLLDAINFSFVYVLPLRWGRYLGSSSVLAANLNLIGRFVTPGSTGTCKMLIFCHFSSCSPSLAFSLEFFSVGGANLLLCKFLLLFYCFRTKFQGGANVSKGRGQIASGGRPLPPL